ncbi:hypothetical protein SCLCIDRAFT_1207721 [Scleroderma citrinum Foug A]|uniref:Uncharacterized protein n=1 Tax=Scleroderma citrinum Foug A TaxID=1036808 RepID=A0A0C3ECE3_9AGAM|nr:hypothetical protein SCLCIDRAFT_1207721 [Scleroderma citrinum Foug A]
MHTKSTHHVLFGSQATHTLHLVQSDLTLRLRAPKPRHLVSMHSKIPTWACRAVGVVTREHVWVIQRRYSCTGESYPGGHGMPIIHFLQKREKRPPAVVSRPNP